MVGGPGRPLGTTSTSVDQVAYIDALDLGRPYSQQDVVVLRSGAGVAHEQTFEALARLPEPERPRVVVAGELADAAFRALIEHHGVAHIMASRDGEAELDLAVTVDKLLSNDLFGMGRYFVGEGAPERFVCRSAAQRDELLDWVRAYGATHHIRARLVDVLMVAADEMFTNALYNAPTDGSGNHLYAGLSRSVKVVLNSPSHVEIELRCDGQRLGIATVDPFGSLQPQVVLESLKRCFHRAEPRPGSTGGAGLGLYLLLGSLSHVIFNVALGRRTEVIGLMDISGGYRGLAAAGKSFNLFVER